MNYADTLEYIDSFINFEKIPRYNYASSFNLERMQAFLQELGNPHKVLKVIHIAGSKGKGSTCAIIASILKEAGYRVGLYTSPHLTDTRERIRVLVEGFSQNGQARLDPRGFEGVIKKEEFTKLIEQIKPVAERFRDHKELGRLSFFEILTACAFSYFKDKKVDFAVLETGLGGRLDATNVTESIISGIANIGIEHTDKLGNSLEAIALEKAGIVKTKGLVVSVLQEEEVIDVIRGVCKDRRAKLYEIAKDINYSIVKSDKNGQTFDLDGPGYSYNDLQLNLLGRHQAENATLAVSIAKLIKIEVTEKNIRDGLKNVLWPGRLQIVQKDPYVILDGAHNITSIKAVLSSIKEIFDYKRLICVFGILSDKDIEGVARELDNASSVVILTRPNNSRAKEPTELKKHFVRSSIVMKDNINAAMDRALDIADIEDLILITGSLYLTGELKQGI